MPNSSHILSSIDICTQCGRLGDRLDYPCHRVVKIIDLGRFIDDKAEWSRRTFGIEYNHRRILNHIRKELVEIEEDPSDPMEWVDVIFLALDGLSRQGLWGAQVVALMQDKHKINLGRTFAPFDPHSDQPGEHVRDKS